MRVVRTQRAAGSIAARRLAVAEMGARRLDDLREADHRDDVLHVHRTAVDLLEEVDRLVEPAELGVVVLDVAGRELRDLLHLDVVYDRREDLFARAVPE